MDCRLRFDYTRIRWRSLLLLSSLDWNSPLFFVFFTMEILPRYVIFIEENNNFRFKVYRIVYLYWPLYPLLVCRGTKLPCVNQSLRFRFCQEIRFGFFFLFYDGSEGIFFHSRALQIEEFVCEIKLSWEVFLGKKPNRVGSDDGLIQPR